MEGKTQETAAAKAGMSVRSARKWQSGPLPSQAKPEHRWRTRPDPFDGVWEDEIEPLLRNDPAGKLKATTIIDWLRSVNAVLHWTQWRCCTQSGKPSRRWRRSCPLNSGPRPRGESLERFLARLPDRWREEHQQVAGKLRARAPHTWRTRKDPFEGVWCDVLGWLQEDPDASAVALLGRAAGG